MVVRGEDRRREGPRGALFRFPKPGERALARGCRWNRRQPGGAYDGEAARSPPAVPVRASDSAARASSSLKPMSRKSVIRMG